MKKAGSSRRAFLAFGGTIISSGTPTLNTWYIVLKKAATGSGIPAQIPLNTPFKTRATGTLPALASGDQLLRINFERFCKTTADWSMEQGSIDVGDDCDPGANISDGITAISGSLAGFFQFDDATEELVDISSRLINRFMPGIEDAGNGTYTYGAPTNEKIYLGLCLNGDTAVGNIENWFLTPINISSLSGGGGNADGQTMEVSWSKGEGAAVSYKVPRTA